LKLVGGGGTCQGFREEFYSTPFVILTDTFTGELWKSFS